MCSPPSSSLVEAYGNNGSKEQFGNLWRNGSANLVPLIKFDVLKDYVAAMVESYLHLMTTVHQKKAQNNKFKKKTECYIISNFHLNWKKKTKQKTVFSHNICSKYGRDFCFDIAT